jgi:futalosine hydrolase
MESKILIIAAVKEELENLVHETTDQVRLSTGGRTAIDGRLFDQPVRIVVSGPGMVNMTQALCAAIEHEKPRLIVHTGVAGCFKNTGMDMGDIGVALEEIDADLGVESGQKNRHIDALPFPVINRNGRKFKNRFPLDPILVEKAYAAVKADFRPKGIGVKKGPFVTVSTITASAKREDRLNRQFRPLMEAMEGAAVAHLALHYRLPCVEIRSVSNQVGERDRNRWNLPLAFRRCASAVLVFIRGL